MFHSAELFYLHQLWRLWGNWNFVEENARGHCCHTGVSSCLPRTTGNKGPLSEQTLTTKSLCLSSALNFPHNKFHPLWICAFGEKSPQFGAMSSVRNKVFIILYVSFIFVILSLNKASVFLGSQNRCLIQQIFQICAGKAWRSLCHPQKIHILA